MLTKGKMRAMARRLRAVEDERIVDSEDAFATAVRVAVEVAIAAERERCAKIAEAIDSGRGNEKEIARAIRNPTG